ncbi:MAG: hypothetical protein ABIS08_00360 [Pseudolysinimonas sp.]
MPRLRHPKLMGLIALITVLTLGIGGAAYGYWRATGAGTGTGSTGTTVAVTLGPGTPSSSLYPGGQASVVLTVTNTNDSNVHISTLSLNTAQGTGGFSVDAGHAGCSVAALTFSTQSNGGAGWSVPARVGAVNGTLAITLTNALAMSTSAADACQGATFTVYLAAG